MDYFKEISDAFSKVEVTDAEGKVIPFTEAISQVVELILEQNKKGSKVMLIGNGGSASIAAHIATDLLKNGDIPALAFTNPSLLTCLFNDLGYDYVFKKPVEILAKEGDILFSISSSGQSRNIISATMEGKKKACFLVTFSGFKKDNPLRRLGCINFYVPSDSYGCVEITHLAICHFIADTIIRNKNK
jgi:D-sedoheptulose 7-phosphate isomerase